jgi:peptidyl-prolyl cis-trans isomerase D
MALKWLRDNLRHLKFILWGVVIVFVLLVFVDWGAGRSGGGGGGVAAVRVGNRTVSEGEFLDEMRRMDQRFSQIYGENWNQIRGQVDLAGQTASYLVDRELQIIEAKKLGITVGPEELRQAILDTPSFVREDGEFVGTDTYKRIIRSYFRMTPEDFEQSLTEDIMISKLNALAERSVWVSDADAEMEFRRQREVADFDVIQLRYEPYLAEASVAQDEVRAAFERTAEDYRRAEQRVIRYLVVETSKLERLLPVEDAELRAYYEEHRDEFLEGEQANARHILIRIPPDATPQQKTEIEAKANSVAQILAAGGDFAEVAAKHSEDPGSKDNGGDLGWFGRNRMVKEFEDAVFSAKPGELVGPVLSEYGYHIIRVEGFRPEHQQPFEEVEFQVRQRLLEGRASAEAEVLANELARRIETEQPTTQEGWQSIADENEAAALNLSPSFGAGEPIPGASNDGELATEAFDLEIGDIRGPVAVPRGWIVWQLADILPEGIPPFDDVRDQVEQALRRDRAIELAVEKGRELAARWRGGEAAEALAAEYGSTVTEARDYRRGSGVGSLGVIPELDRAVFSTMPGQVLEPVPAGSRGVLVARVETVQLADPVDLGNEIEQVRSRMMADRAGQLMRSILNERRRETTVTVDNELLQRFAPTNS